MKKTLRLAIIILTFLSISAAFAQTSRAVYPQVAVSGKYVLKDTSGMGGTVWSPDGKFKDNSFTANDIPKGSPSYAPFPLTYYSLAPEVTCNFGIRVTAKKVVEITPVTPIVSVRNYCLGGNDGCFKVVMKCAWKLDSLKTTPTFRLEVTKTKTS